METHYTRGENPESVRTRFKKGLPGHWLGRKRPNMSGENHPQWKGEMPKCWCGKVLSRRKAKNCRKHSKYTPKGMSRLKAGAKKRMGKDHPAWLGKDVKYRGLHFWVERKMGKPTTCAHCKKGNLKGHNIHWANISGKYKRKLTDWIRLCAKCHGKFGDESKSKS